MIVVVDTNIVFSGILSPHGTICDLLLNSGNAFVFYAPTALFHEITAHHEKLLKISGLTEDELNFLIRTILKKVELIDLESVRQTTWEKAIDHKAPQCGSSEKPHPSHIPPPYLYRINTIRCTRISAISRDY